MVSKLLPILFILPIIHAKIEIDILATDVKERDVRVSGSSVDLISDLDRKTFDLTDEHLKQSISTYFGQMPDSVYLRNPTPWGGLYKTFNWEPVKRVFSPKKATILSVETEPVLIDTTNLVNEDAEPKTFNEKFHHSVETKVSSKWDKSDESEAEDIHYHLDMKIPDDSMYIGFTAKWGENTKKTIPMNVASEFQVTLNPKQNAMVQVLVTKETMKIRVDYETSLVGAAAVSYDKEYKGHRFWAMDINTVLEAGGLKKQLQRSEVIDVVHYKDATVLVKDADTGDVIYTAPLKMY